MHIRFVTLIASVALLGACQTAPEEAATTSGAGSGSTSTTSAAPPSAPAMQQAAPATDAVTPGSQADLAANVGDRVFFAFDKAGLEAEARSTLERQATWLKRHPSVRVVVEGHADERGTREYNLALGERRANSARDYLVSLGIDPSRVETVSYGEERPYAMGSNEAAWRLNRRVVTVVR
ncbi:MAG: peptidoglycan-associated lipoprotein Pal [Acetobacterales bacterium]